MTVEVTAPEIDRRGWLPGPWDGEPDKLNWTTEAGLPGMIVRNRSGALCGYAAVNPGHALYRKSYHEVEADIDVHGGLTYSNSCRGPICHVPEPGQPDDVWWFGFDCNHYLDSAPGDERNPFDFLDDASFGAETPRGYKPIAYVRAEVESLARQLVEITA